jgi:hypothetical protein
LDKIDPGYESNRDFFCRRRPAETMRKYCVVALHTHCAFAGFVIQVFLSIMQNFLH